MIFLKNIFRNTTNTMNMTMNKNGDKYWYVNDKLHRENGLPAVEYANGNKEWYVNGKRHRETPLGGSEGVDLLRTSFEPRKIKLNCLIFPSKIKLILY